MAEANIQIVLKGLLVLFPDFPKKGECTVGVLRDAPPGHPLIITVKKKNANGDFEDFKVIQEKDVKNKMTVLTSNTSSAGISRRNQPINRKTGPAGGNEHSFLW